MIEAFAEFLFYLTGGIPLVMTPWLVPYVAIMVLIIVGITYVGIWLTGVKPKWKWWVNLCIGPLIIVPLIFVMFVGMGSAMVQPQFLRFDCNEQTIQHDTGNQVLEITIKECKEKKNYYSDEYEWIGYTK